MKTSPIFPSLIILSSGRAAALVATYSRGGGRKISGMISDSGDSITPGNLGASRGYWARVKSVESWAVHGPRPP
jgi:hypothetical protein